MLAVFVFFLCFVAPTAGVRAQEAGAGSSSSSAPARGQETTMHLGGGAARSIAVRVLGPHGLPLQEQALVRIYAEGASSPLETEVTAKGSRTVFRNPPSGRYLIEVVSAGYRITRKTVDYSEAARDIEVEVTLDDAPEDGGLISSSALPRKAQKQVDRGLAEFESGDLKAAGKELAAAYKKAPNNSDVAYLLGSLYLREKEFEKAEALLEKVIAIDPANVPALVALGQLRYENARFGEAAEFLRKAVAIDPKQWLSLWLLSDIHLRAGDYETARNEAQQAVDSGKGAANAAEFIAGEALARLGRTAEAVQMLQAFLHDAPQDANAPAARALAWRLQVGSRAGGTLSASASLAATQTVPSVAPALVQAPPPKLLVPSWEPPGVDQQKLPVADGVTCPAEQVVEETGVRVGELVDSVNRIAATESVVYQELSTLGHPIDTQRQKFDYLISISENRPGLLTINEDRSGSAAYNHALGNILPFGLADLPLVFHPEMRSDFQITCEGLGRWDGRATWLVYFRQRADRPQRIRAYELLDGASYTAGLKGRAWIAADTYQIVRLEADLMKPIPQIGLGSEEDVIEYGPVPFQTKNTVLWLPTSADVYFYYQHRPFHHHHEFTKYQLFSVSASQKIGQPAMTPDKNNH